MANLTYFEDLTDATSVAFGDYLVFRDVSETSAWTKVKEAPLSAIMNSMFNITTGATGTVAIDGTATIVGCSYTDTGAVTATIATAALAAGKVIIVKDIGGSGDTNNITIATEGDETIDGAATKVIDADYGVARLYSDGTNWFSF